MRTLREDQSTFVLACRCILLRTRNASDKRCTESRNKYFLFNKFCSENRSFNEVMWKNIIELDRPEMMMYYRTRQARDDNVSRCMGIACWSANATGTDSVYLTIIASPR